MDHNSKELLLPLKRVATLNKPFDDYNDDDDEDGDDDDDDEDGD